MDITKLRTENDSTYFEGKCVAGNSGKSKGASGSVVGCVSGSSLTFVEERCSVIGDKASTPYENLIASLYTPRLSIDGGGFEGIYRRCVSGGSGHISGRFLDRTVHLDQRELGNRRWVLVQLYCVQPKAIWQLY